MRAPGLLFNLHRVTYSTFKRPPVICDARVGNMSVRSNSKLQGKLFNHERDVNTFVLFSFLTWWRVGLFIRWGLEMMLTWSQSAFSVCSQFLCMSSLFALSLFEPQHCPLVHSDAFLWLHCVYRCVTVYVFVSDNVCLRASVYLLTVWACVDMWQAGERTACQMQLAGSSCRLFLRSEV